MKAAFQGVEGAYSELAIKGLLGANCKTVSLDGFPKVFQAVEKGRVQRGVIPIENTLAGSIHQNYDLLQTHDLQIVAETHLRVEHVLMCHPDSSEKKITAIRSHPQALAQCSGYFQMRPHIKEEPYFDTAGAAKSIAEENNPHTGAIASAYAASLFGLKVLRRNLENHSKNYTRFLVISKKPLAKSKPGPRKCSITVTPNENHPGLLFRILSAFALRDIDLFKVESRPLANSIFEYQFYLDFKGSPEEKKVQKAIQHVEEMATVRVLGAYPPGGVLQMKKSGIVEKKSGGIKE